MNNNQQIPLRGVAMILIAVAVALGFWVAVSVIRGGGDDSTSAQNSSTTTVATSSASASTAATGSTAAAADSAESEAPAEGAGESTAAAAGPQPVNVLNNSMVSGLANRVGDQVRGAGFTLGYVGNYAESNFPNSVVLYPAGDAAAQAEAERIAQVLNIPAQVIPEGVNVNGVTVITTADLDR
ncbi:MAG: LytR C-terminal domain-containing protein [Corynebacterium sp.]|nr:LytR C-terminal domain-containing protein [Corynebacterium sp.]